MHRFFSQLPALYLNLLKSRTFSPLFRCLRSARCPSLALRALSRSFLAMPTIASTEGDSHQRNIFHRQNPLSARRIILTSGQRSLSAPTNLAKIAHACLAGSMVLGLRELTHNW